MGITIIDVSNLRPENLKIQNIDRHLYLKITNFGIYDLPEILNSHDFKGSTPEVKIH